MEGDFLTYALEDHVDRSLICSPMLRIGNGSLGFRFFASGRKSVSPFLKKGEKEAPDYRISIIEFV